MLKAVFKSEFFNNISWQWFSASITASFGFIQSVILARHLGVHDFGVFALAMGVTTLAMQLVDIRYLDVLVKYLSDFRENKPGKFCLSLILLSLFYAVLVYVIVLLLFVCFGDIIQGLFFTEEKPSSTRILLLLCLSNVFVNLHLYPLLQSVFRVYSLVKLLSILTACLYSVRLLMVIVVLWYMEFGLQGVLFTLLAINILFLFLYGIIAVRTLLLDSSSGFCYYNPLFLLEDKKLRKFIKNIYLTSLFSIPSKELDINILGVMADPAQIGIYRVAKNFYSVVWAFIDPVVLVLYADLTRKYFAKEYNKIALFIRNVSVLGFIMAVLVILLALIGFEHVLNLSVGEEFLEAKNLFCVMLSGSIIWASFVWIYPVLLLLGETRVIFRTTLISGIISACLFFLMTFQYGVLGTTIAYAAAPVIVSILQILSLRNCNSFIPIRQCCYS